MSEPCPRCPPFVVRCGHLGEDEPVQILALPTPHVPPHEFYVVTATEQFPQSPLLGTRAEADAEFERREEALLA